MAGDLFSVLLIPRLPNILGLFGDTYNVYCSVIWGQGGGGGGGVGGDSILKGGFMWPMIVYPLKTVFQMP